MVRPITSPGRMFAFSATQSQTFTQAAGAFSKAPHHQRGNCRKPASNLMRTAPQRTFQLVNLPHVRVVNRHSGEPRQDMAREERLQPIAL